MTTDFVEAIRAGRAVFEWAPLTIKKDDTLLTLWVSADVVRYEDANGKLVRGMVTAEETQELADQFGWILTTPKIEDLIAQNAAVTIAPITQIDGDICAISTPQRHSEEIDKALGKATVPSVPGPHLINTLGKSWVLTNALANSAGLKYGTKTACNYGWGHPSSGYAAVTAGLKVWQPPGYQHNDVHEDPSQTLRVLFRWCNVQDAAGDRQVDMQMAYTDPVLAPLVSHEGVLKVLRQPSVPEPTEPAKLDQLLVYGGPLLGLTPVLPTVQPTV